MRRLLFGLVVLAICGGRVAADTGPTGQGELQNAEVVVLGRGFGPGRVEVEEVIKGVESRHFLAAAGAEAGKRVVVLERYQERQVRGGGNLEAIGDGPAIAAGVWPVREGEKGLVELPRTGWGAFSDAPTTSMQAFTEELVKSAPEAAYLEGQVEESLFSPQKAAARAAADPQQGACVQVKLAVHESRRDVEFLAGFLESKDVVVRAGAQRTQMEGRCAGRGW
jgi:hypothetical protein